MDNNKCRAFVQDFFEKYYEKLNNDECEEEHDDNESNTDDEKELADARCTLEAFTKSVNEKVDDESDIYNAIDVLYESSLHEETISWILKIPEKYWSMMMQKNLFISIFQ